MRHPLFSVLFGLLLAITGCAPTIERVRPNGRSRQVTVNAVLALLKPDMEKSFREGPPFALAELDALAAPGRHGPEGADAAALWRSDVEDHYRAARQQIRRALRAEVSRYDDATLDSAVLPPVSDSFDAYRGGLATKDYLLTETARRAHADAICASLVTTPRRWARRYPARPRFIFERFGIDRQVFTRRCAASPSAD